MYWILKNVVLGPLLRVLYRPKARGLENIPGHGPVERDSTYVELLIDTIRGVTTQRGRTKRSDRDSRRKATIRSTRDARRRNALRRHAS